MYTLIRFIISIALRQFFSKIEVRGASFVDRGPLLLVSNHPNLALDPLIISLISPRQLWFLGKATLFTGLLGPVLRALHVIPVYRKQDDPSQLAKNTGTFSAAASILIKGGALAIFPEGVSLGERRISQIKTGAARILLQAVQDGAELPIRIQAVGITYEDLQRFRARVTVRIQDPVSLDSREMVSSPNGVKAVTAMIEEVLRSVTVDIPTPEQQEIAEHLARVYGSSLREGDDFDRFRAISHHLAMLTEWDIARHQGLLTRVRAFARKLDERGVLDGEPLELPVQPGWGGLSSFFGIAGAVAFWLPYRIVGGIARRAAHPVEVASRKFFAGLILFPVWVAMGGILSMWCGGTTPGVLVVMLLCLLGFHANRVMPNVTRALLNLSPGRQGTELSELIAERDSLLQELEAIRNSMVSITPPSHREKE